MRIALITPGFSRDRDDWAIPALQNLATTLAQTCSVTVFSLRYPASGRYQLGPVSHHASGGGTRFGWRSLPIWGRALRAMIAEHRQRPFDVLHAFWADEPGFTAVLAGQLLRRPVIVSIGGGELVHLPDIAYGTQASRYRRRLVAYSLQQARLVTAGSRYQLEQVKVITSLPPGRLHLAPLGVARERFYPAPRPERAAPVIIQAASLVPVKDQALLLTVIQQARQSLPRLQLRLAGEGPLAAPLRRQAEAMGLAGAIQWVGKVPYPRMAAFLGHGRLYLQSSRHESQGMAVLEALACGLPAIGTPVGILPEVAARPAQWDAAVLAGQLVELITDPAAYRQAARLATETAANFDLTQTTPHFISLYQQLTNQH